MNDGASFGSNGTTEEDGENDDEDGDHEDDPEDEPAEKEIRKTAKKSRKAKKPAATKSLPQKNPRTQTFRNASRYQYVAQRGRFELNIQDSNTIVRARKPKSSATATSLPCASVEALTRQVNAYSRLVAALLSGGDQDQEEETSLEELGAGLKFATESVGTAQEAWAALKAKG
ncbi:hypothetical protein Slin15195_G130760 [Septoria linicola]|uniref:Uncharacterized protein n=1 Tax=Septoria linicola TaxID=215465 RepID=A0A9Q9B9H5_9PEZI|nr:hypothetical protein Slin14017_G128390 [Septoria linicola]USW59757.1 hypothetical protein Slin15195_G130760 [Septoria linicola]